MVFKAVLSDPELLKSSIPIIAEIIDEGIFKVDKDGIKLLSPDRTMVSVVDLKILSSAFDEFKADEPADIGVNMANFVAILKRIKGTDKLTLELEKNKLKFTVEGDGKRKFDLPLLDVKVEKPPVDQLNFTGKIELESSVIEEGVADAEVIGDSVFLEAKPESFKMFAKGDVSSTELELTKDSKSLLGLEVKEAIKAQYPIEYLKKMIKAAKISPQIVLEFGTDYPMRLSFKSLDKLSLAFVLAPRVSED
ncbi:MAG: proliferating cell nuclear antigen (pcna) [Candidatus Aenigmarchaeota archaeon]|nr:proliferating cell nuclear antigen (pcna) [Candidatus Aenigmarchaeota archaeon]